MTQNFRHKITLAPRFGDVDMMGHVNNAKYITYIEESRIGYAREVMGWNGNPHDLAMILARTEMDYLLPIVAGQTVDIFTRCSRLGSKSFDLEYLILTADSQQEVAKARTIMVAFDYPTQTTIPIPDEWREKILAYENVKPV